MPAQALRALTTGRFALSGSSHASCSLAKGIIRVVDLFEVILPVGASGGGAGTDAAACGARSGARRSASGAGERRRKRVED